MFKPTLLPIYGGAQSELVEHKEAMSENSLHLATIMEVTDEDKLVAVNDPDEEYEPITLTSW